MQRVFADEFSLNLPRSSHEQIKQGSQISKDALHTGDLVFLKPHKIHDTWVCTSGKINLFMHLAAWVSLYQRSTINIGAHDMNKHGVFIMRKLLPNARCFFLIHVF
ncbi:NlpC/P60 family protein [Yersinia rohdei]